MKTKAKKPPEKQPKEYPPGSHVALIPVKITIEHGGTIAQDHEDVIDIACDESTPEGKKTLAKLLYLTHEKGLSTESALFTLASEAVNEQAQKIAAPISTPTHHELHLHVSRNGEITYRKYL
jgi:hypothetical protein